MLESPSTSDDDDINIGVYKLTLWNLKKTLNEKKQDCAVRQHKIW